MSVRVSYQCVCAGCLGLLVMYCCGGANSHAELYLADGISPELWQLASPHVHTCQPNPLDG